jgi:hypothetical protein
VTAKKLGRKTKRKTLQKNEKQLGGKNCSLLRIEIEFS